MSEATIFVTETGIARVAPDGPVATPGGPLSYVHWGPIIAGAVVASAAFFVLMAFAAAIGLAVASGAPTWRDTSLGLTVLSAAWVVLVSVGSYALGGYVAGRVRSSWSATADEVHFRDGLHGLLVWGLAVIIGVVLAWAAAMVVAAASSATVARSSAPAAAAEAFMPFELDRLFRSDRRPEAGDLTQSREEAARILQTGLGHRDMAADDRAYLSRLVVARTGLSQPDADRRVTQIVTESRDSAAKARRSAVILGFTLAAALAAAAAAAWGAALIGGRHRDEDIAPPLRHSWRPRGLAS